MAVGWRWVLACTLGCTLWSLPVPAGPIGLLLGGVVMALVMRDVTDRAWRLAWSLPLALVVIVPIGFVVIVTMAEGADDADVWAGWVLAAAIGGALLGLLHALVFADWIDWWRWVVGGAVTGPSIGLVFVSWAISVPLGFVPGVLYGLATCVPATRAIGRLQEARP